MKSYILDIEMENFVECLFSPRKVDLFYNFKNILKIMFFQLYVDNTFNIKVDHLFVDKMSLIFLDN
jgi:hypothetical protein